jgi:group I intron endonuclease
MRILKNNVILRLFNSYLVDSPQPANISYVWNFGSLLGVCLVLQILTGCFLAMHYVANIDLAFNSVEHIMRDVENGYLIRYIHANVASFFFIFVYAHVGRNIYYGSFKSPRILVWSIGVIILILMMAIGFLGYKHSPKWSKSNNDYIYYKYKNSPRSAPLNKNYHIYKNTIGKRYYSTPINKPIITNSEILNDFIEENNLKPIYCYEDLHLETIKTQIKKDTKDLSGIYLILNKITLDYYIGSAATNRFYARFSNHLINFHGSKIVKLAVRKYKLPNFAFVILDLFPEIVTKENNKKLLDLEDFYLKSLLPNYNILTEAGSSFGYKHTEIARIKMKTNYSQNRRDLIGNLNRGNKLSEETKEKIRQKSLSRINPTYTEQGIINITKKSKPVILYNKDNTVYGEFSSIVNAANFIRCNEKTIIRALKSESKLLLRRWIVKYKYK